MSDIDPRIRIDLSIDEINLVFEALGSMPFSRVHQLIAKLQAQAEEQINATTPNSSGSRPGTEPP